jgi:sulfopyruvate decarboxylase subunit alpha
MTMEPLLNAMRIPYRLVNKEDEIARAISDAFLWAYSAYYHTSVILTGEVVR